MRIGEICCLAIMLASVPLTARAHLCNDVFAQARDNLVVKVDIRDGQLRVGKEGGFRVYLLNTMERDIAEIALEVESAEFEAEAKPSPEWTYYPALHTTHANPAWRAPGRREGRKEYFNVTLRRKPGVPDGSYKIALNLVSKRMNMSFRSIDLDSAADIATVPLAAGMVIDGKATRDKWNNSFLCANFNAYRKAGRYMESVPAAEQTRVRFAHDRDNLYLMASFHGGDNSQGDTLSVHVAANADDSPRVLTIDRRGGKITTNGREVVGATAIADPKTGAVEVRIPRGALGLEKADRFLMNLTRSIANPNGKTEISYWRGNELSLAQPISYGQFVLAN